MPRRSRSPSRSRSRSPRSTRRPAKPSTRDRSRRRRHSRSASSSRSRSRSRGRHDHQRRLQPRVDHRRQPEQRRASRSSSPPRRARDEQKKPKDFTHLLQWGKAEDAEQDGAPGEDQPVEKPNFGLSGALAKDRATGNVQNGVVMKFSEPPEARAPRRRYRLYVFKNDNMIATLHVHRKSAFLVGRDKTVADILTEHESCSKQHAVLQYRMFQKPTEDGLGFEQEIRPYIMDLESTNGTYLNGSRIDGARYIELKVKDVLKFGESTREYVLMDAS